MLGTATLADGHARDPRTRYEGGFDRWSSGARSGWSLICRNAEQIDYVAGEDRTAWYWDRAARIWSRMPDEAAETIWREHANVMHRMRRAMLAIRLYPSELPAEREAACAALRRIATAIAQDLFPQGGAGTLASAWFDHPAAIYLAATCDSRFHLQDGDRARFEPEIFQQLVRLARADHAKGLRANPPRLRVSAFLREDSKIEPHEPARGAARAEPEEPDPAAPPEGDDDQIKDLRVEVARNIAQEDVAEENWRRARRRWGPPGILAALTVVVLTYLAVH